VRVEMLSPGKVLPAVPATVTLPVAFTHVLPQLRLLSKGDQDVIGVRSL
jgi:hypothetical protein